MLDYGQNAGGLKLVPPGMQRDTAYWREACVARQWWEEMQSSPWMGRAHCTPVLVFPYHCAATKSPWQTTEK